MKNIEGGTFLAEASKKVPEKLIRSQQEAVEFVEKNKIDKSFLLDLARNCNREFQNGIEKVPPILIYGTVDPVGNVSELLTMMQMSDKLQVPMVLILDDVCHDLNSCAERIMAPSFDTFGLNGKYSTDSVRFTEILADEVLPEEIILMMRNLRLSNAVSLSEAYEAGLYLLAKEFFGDSAFQKLAILRTSEIFGGNSLLGQIPLSLLREKVISVGQSLDKERLVFLHVDGEKIYSDDERFDSFNLSDLYTAGGSLGGTAHVSLTTMLLDDQLFGKNVHPLLLAEKDTGSGANFASVYKELLKSEFQAKIVVSGIRRIKASRTQTGGDGVDPLVLLFLLNECSDGLVYKRMIVDIISDAYKHGEKVVREKELVLSDSAAVSAAKVALLKEKLGIDGSLLISMGVDKKKIGHTLLNLSDMMLQGEFNSKAELLETIKSI